MNEIWAVKKVFKAFETKDIRLIESLVAEECINPNTLIPGKGVSLLHLIIGHQSEKFALAVTKLFLRCGGDPNVESAEGVTPIHVAAAWGRNRILHLLLVNGGDPWMQDEEKKNAFNYAFEEREWSTIEMLHRFQQMHSGTNCKEDVNRKYEKSFERILLRKGEEMLAFAPSRRKSMKSMTTQTQTEREVTMESPEFSPIKTKIKYFEPSNVDKEESRREWLKDFYQSSCEVVVHNVREGDESEIQGEKEKKEETFVSSMSIEMETSPVDASVNEKSEQSLMDVRGQLFEELQEAVRRRSKLKMVQEENKVEEEVEIEEEKKDKVKEKIGTAAGKKVSYLYGVNLEESGMLKNMSDLATKVMNEIEMTKQRNKNNKNFESVADKTVDLCLSSPELSGTYLSCENEVSQQKSGGEKENFGNMDTSNLYLTPCNSQLVTVEGKEDNSNESFVSVAEEYKYTDAEEGVVLLEKKLVVTPTIRLGEVEEEEEMNEVEGASLESSSSTVSTIPSSLSYNSDVLRYELNGLGYNPGPITTTTKKLYLKKLWKLKKEFSKSPNLTEKGTLSRVHSPILERTLTNREFFDEISKFNYLEEEMTKFFETWKKKKWREGTNMTSFNYLLLDPRVSLNLPKRASNMTKLDVWKCFLSGIFYVGKGKRCRPYAHLYKAIGVWEKRLTLPLDNKTAKIIDIWKEGLGVICLQVFQNVIPVEALTREASMIDALGLSSLKNVKGGEYYGVASTWPMKDKIRLGTYLLHKAMLIFMNEGERQIKPYDID